MNKVVSIIIPTYKRNENLEETIQSVLKQTYKDIEIIVVDDNNPDTEYRKNNEELMKKYENNQHIVYIKHEKNKNGAAARNTGIKAAKGEYIAFLDDDDLFLERKIEKQVEFLDNNAEYDCVSCQVYSRGKVIKQKINQNTLLQDILSLKVSPITSTLMFRKIALEKINGFNENYKRHQDLELMVRYLQNGKLAYIEEPLTVFGVNEGENILKGEQLDNLKAQFLSEFMPVIDELDKKKKGSKRKILCSHYVARAKQHLKNKDYELLKNVLKDVYLKYPITFTIYFIKSLIIKVWIEIKWRLNNDKDNKK